MAEKGEARSVDKGQFPAAVLLEHPGYGFEMVGIGRQQLETRKLGQGESKRAGRVLAQPVQEPAVGLGDDESRCPPSSGWVGEEPGSGAMITVAPVEERHEDPGVQENAACRERFRAAAGRR